MKILSFDTSSDVLSAGVFDGEKKLAFYEFEASTRHSEILAPVLEKVLKSSKMNWTKIGCVAVCVGPGSFTGLRIGVTTAKILSYALKINLIGVSSLEAMARSVEREGTFAVMRDAKKTQVYAAVYQRKNKKWKILQKPAILFREDFLKSLRPEMMILDSTRSGASAVAAIAWDRIRLKNFDEPFSLEPLYLHPKDCNVSVKK